MARKASVRVAGGWYHACSRGHNREMIFGEERDYTHFLELLDAMREQFRVRVHAYCLMPNHYHLVEERIRQGTPEAWLQHVRWGLVLGSERFARRVRGRIAINREHTGRADMQRRRTFAEIVAQVERVKREPWDSFRDRYGDWGRDLALWLARRYGGLRLRELGAAAGGMDYTAVANAVLRLPVRAKRDPGLRQAMERLQRECEK